MSFLSSISILSYLTWLDWAVFAFCLIATGLSVWIGQKMRKQGPSFLDLLVMGRQLTLPLFVATLVATWYGGIFGVTQIAFEHGIYNFLTQGVFWYVTYIIFAFFLVKKIRQFKAVTLPELVGEMFGPRSKVIASIFNFFNCVPVAYVMSMGLFFQSLFGGSLVANMILGIGMVLIYAYSGGFRADVFSDLIQFFVMCSSVAIVAILSYTTFGGMDFLKTHLPATHFEWLGGHSAFQTFAWGLIALATLVDPNFYQRCFAAKSEKTARYGILISTFVWICFDICTTAGGLYARALIPEAESGLAYLTYGVQLLPNGLRGFFLAGIFATIASTLDSFLLIASASLHYDLGTQKMKHSRFWRHASILAVSILSIVLALSFDGSIKAVWKTFGSYAAACLLLPVMLGYAFPKHFTDFQFCFSSILGAVVVTWWRFLERSGIWADIDEIYCGIAATALGLMITSLRLKPLQQR